MGVIRAINLVGEDAVMFQQPLIYSLKTKTQVLAWRYPRELAQLHFPSEIKDELKVNSLPKYRWLFERMDRFETQLSEIENYGVL
jgi:hypothetical protein